MDDATVRHINSLSARDSAPLTTELEFKIGGRVLELPDEAPDDLADLFKAYGRNDILRSPTRAADYDRLSLYLVKQLILTSVCDHPILPSFLRLVNLQSKQMI